MTDTPKTGAELIAERDEYKRRTPEPNREVFDAYWAAETTRAGFDGDQMRPHLDAATFTDENGRIDRTLIRQFAEQLGRSARRIR